MQNQSEVARIREQIDREIEALQLLRCGFAMVASHAAISHRYETLGSCMDRLAEHIGEENAIATICDRINALL